MGLKRIGKGPFKGPTPKGVFQTIDLGSGIGANYIYKQAKKNPKRKYLALDTQGIILKGKPPGSYRFEKPFPPMPRNAKVSRKDALSKLKELAKLGKQTRNIQISMPSGRLLNSIYLEKIAEISSKVLFPNGKVHILTPIEPEVFEKVIALFKKNGFKCKARPSTNFSFKKYSSKAEAWFEQYGSVFWEYEFTYSLKAAIPNKAQRRKWPGGK